MFPVNGSSRAAAPFPPAGPGEPGSPPLRGTMKPLRRPAALGPRLMFSPRASTWSWLFVLAEALPVVAKPATGPGALLSRRSIFRRLPRGCRRDLSGSQVTHPVPLPCSKTPAEPVGLTMTAVPVLPPHPTRRRLRRFHDFEAYGTASAPAVYASRAELPPPMQDSLPAGGLRLCREGVEPSGSRRKVSGHIHPPFQGLP